MSGQHAFKTEEWAWLYEEAVPGEFQVTIAADESINCDPRDIHIARDKIGLIKVWLDDLSNKEYEFVTLVFEDDYRKACTQRLLGKKEIMIVDDNRRESGEVETIKFSVFARSKREKKALYLDPRIVNE